MNPYTIVQFADPEDASQTTEYIRYDNGNWGPLNPHCEWCAEQGSFYTEDTLPQPYKVLAVGVDRV